jgi:hypothetical protein
MVVWGLSTWCLIRLVVKIKLVHITICESEQVIGNVSVFPSLLLYEFILNVMNFEYSNLFFFPFCRGSSNASNIWSYIKIFLVQVNCRIMFSTHAGLLLWCISLHVWFSARLFYSSVYWYDNWVVLMLVSFVMGSIWGWCNCCYLLFDFLCVCSSFV